DFSSQRFIEEESNIPADSKIVDHVWAKINKDGSPDLRFKGNCQTPVVHYGVLTFRGKDKFIETFVASNPKATEIFANEFQAYLELLKDKPVERPAKQSFTNEYFA